MKRKRRTPIFRLTRGGALEPTLPTVSPQSDSQEAMEDDDFDPELIRRLGEYATPLPEIEPMVSGVMGNNLYPLAFIRIVQAQARRFRYEDMQEERKERRFGRFSSTQSSPFSSFASRPSMKQFLLTYTR